MSDKSHGAHHDSHEHDANRQPVLKHQRQTSEEHTHGEHAHHQHSTVSPTGADMQMWHTTEMVESSLAAWLQEQPKVRLATLHIPTI